MQMMTYHSYNYAALCGTVDLKMSLSTWPELILGDLKSRELIFLRQKEKSKKSEAAEGLHMTLLT